MDFKDFLLESFEDADVIEKDVKMGGKPRKMKFKAVSAALGDEIRRKSRRTTFHKGQKLVETDQDEFVDRLITATTVYPDFKNAGLQDAWGVTGELELFRAMKTKMSDGEYAELTSIVNGINGYDQSMEDRIEEVKN